MKKFISAILSLFCCAMFVAPACSASHNVADGRSEEVLNQENAITAPAPISFQLVGNDLTASSGVSLMGVDVEQFKASEMNGNYLFSESSFSSVLGQAKDLKKAIYDGNIVAVFEQDGIKQAHDLTLNLPIQFPTDNNIGTQSEYTTVARMYTTNLDGTLRAAEVAVPSGTSDEDAYNYFTECAYEFSDVDSQLSMKSVNSSGRIGTAEKYFSGRNGLGNLKVVYDLHFEETADGNDYYLYHGYIDASPVSKTYKLDNLTTAVGIFGDDVTTYAPSPNSTVSQVSYTISAVPTALSDSLTYLPQITWDLNTTNVTIARTMPDQYNYCWELDFGSTFIGGYKFEPGGTIRVSEGERFTVHTDHTMKLRGYSTEVDSTFFFICDPDGITQA